MTPVPSCHEVRREPAGAADFTDDNVSVSFARFGAAFNFSTTILFSFSSSFPLVHCLPSAIIGIRKDVGTFRKRDGLRPRTRLQSLAEGNIPGYRQSLTRFCCVGTAGVEGTLPPSPSGVEKKRTEQAPLAHDNSGMRSRILRCLPPKGANALRRLCDFNIKLWEIWGGRESKNEGVTEARCQAAGESYHVPATAWKLRSRVETQDWSQFGGNFGQVPVDSGRTQSLSEL
ncbi:hypothetical protein BJ912DRAFT_927153 [Pholiota molesta]|nr:hypothetical protein BJ912DRAFT_927153 [Pholiota molesta]